MPGKRKVTKTAGGCTKRSKMLSLYMRLRRRLRPRLNARQKRMLREEAEREAEEKTAHEAEYAGLVREYEDLSKISLEVFLEVSEEDLRAEFRRLNMKLAHKLAFFVLYRKARGGVSSSAPAAIVSETSQVDEKPLINIIYASFGSPSLYSLSYYCY